MKDVRANRILLFFVLMLPVLISGQSWEPEQRLTYADSCAKIWGITQWPVAAGFNGTVHVVWEDRRDGWPKEVYYKRSLDNGQTWESEIALTANSQFFQNAPCIVVDRQNRLHVVYTEEVWVGGVVYPTVHYKKSMDGGNTWGAEATIASLNGLVMHWSLATDLRDGVYIVYTNQTGYWYDEIDVFIKYSTDAGYTWRPARQLSTSMAALCGSVAADTLGKVHVVWLDNETGDWQIMYRRSTDMGQTWQSTQTLTTGSSFKGLPSISSDRVNTVHVVWYDDRDGQDEVYYIRSTDSGETWDSESRLSDSGVAYRGSGANIACDLLDNVYVVWTDTIAGLGAIRFKESTDGGNTWRPDTILISADGVNFYPGVIGSGDGEYLHLVWNDKRTGYFEIYHKRRIPGGWVQERLVTRRDNAVCIKLMQNPASYSVFLKVTPPAGEKISVKIFNLSGESIATLANYLSKPALLKWDGTDDRGCDVPSGVYIVAARGLGISLQEKVVIVR